MADVERLTDADLERIDKNIADVLLGAAGYLQGKDKKQPINIKRGGKTLFTFTMEPLDERTIEKARKQNTKNKGRRNEEFDGNRYVAQLIYEATIEEDKQRLWRNREVWDKLNITNGADAVQAILTPAERSRLEEIILDMLGFNEDLSEMIEGL